MAQEIQAGKAVVGLGTTEEIRQALARLEQEAQKIGEAMYAQAAGGGGEEEEKL